MRLDSLNNTEAVDAKVLVFFTNKRLFWHPSFPQFMKGVNQSSR